MIKLKVLIDEPDVATAEYALDDVVVRMDDAGLARLLAVWETAAYITRATAATAEVTVAQRPPYKRPDPTPEEMAEIDEETERIRINLGDEAAEQHRAERLQGSGV
jgi:hypothetical protein